MVKPLKRVISEKEFLKLFQKQTNEILKLCTYLQEKEGGKSLYTKRFYGNITTQARLLEDFLDDYGAKNNRTWVYFRELVASARYLGFSAYMLKHIQNRYAFYELRDENKKLFLHQTRTTQKFFNKTIRAVFKFITDEAIKLGLHFPKGSLGEEDFLDVAADKMLPHNLDEGFSSKEEENVVKIATDYLNIMKGHEDFQFDRQYPAEEIAALIPEHISEEKLRKLELSIHNLQSVYDTYIKDTKIEIENDLLNSMRGYISVALHLAEIATALSHFYERHESEVRHEEVRKKLERAIDKNKILECIANYCLFYCYHYLEKGKEIAKKLLKQYAVIESIEVRTPTYMGFHVRPASLVMKIVNHYGSEVKMHLEDEIYDASSALDIFRANEKIRAKKRKLILQEVKPCTQGGKVTADQAKSIVHKELNRLLKEGKLSIYEELSPDNLTCLTEQGSMIKSEDIKTLVSEEINRLVAESKMDIRLDIKVTFTGDRRALKDIESLARANYGEDDKGNNIDLPPEIDYLRK